MSASASNPLKTPSPPPAETPSTEIRANDYQIGGSHYKRDDNGEEHWDRVWRLHGPGYFVGSITKYVERYRDKNGVEDLKKARHFLSKLIELETEREDMINQGRSRE